MLRILKSTIKISLVLLSLLILTNHYCFGQFHRWAAEINPGITNSHIDADSNGSIYSATYARDSIEINGKTTSLGKSGSILAISKFNSEGTCLWTKPIKSLGNKQAFTVLGIKVLNNSNFLLLATFKYNRVIKFNAIDSLISRDTSKFFSTTFLAKFDSSGNCIRYSKVYEGLNLTNHNINLEAFNQEPVFNVFTSLDTISILSKSSIIKFAPNAHNNNLILRFSENFDSIKLFKSIDVGNRAGLSILSLNVFQNKIYFSGYYGGYANIGGKNFKSSYSNPGWKGIIGAMDLKGNITNISQINPDTTQSDIIQDFSVIDSSHFYIVGLVQDSFYYGGKWYSSPGKSKIHNAVRSYPYVALVSFQKAYWVQIAYNKFNDSYYGYTYYGICRHDKQKNLYAMFEQGENPIIIGGLKDTVSASYGFVKLDSLGNALWVRSHQSKNYSIFQSLVILINNQIAYTGRYTDSISLFPLKLKSRGSQHGSFITQTMDYQIIRGKISIGPYCAGDSIKIPFTKTGVFNTNNYFVAELSDEFGKFEGREYELGRIKDTGNSVINGALPMFKVVSSGNYRIRIRSTSPIVQSNFKLDTLRLLIYSKDKANPGPPETICFGDTIQLNTYGGTKWTWSPKYKMSDSTLRQPFVWPQITTTYKIIIADSSGCGAPDTAYKIITVRKPLKVIPSFTDTAICENAPMNIRVRFTGGDSTNYQWEWFFLNSPKSWFSMHKGQTGLEDTLLYFPTVDSITTEKLAVVLKDQCTKKNDTAFVIIRLQSPVKITSKINDTILCNGNFLTLRANALGGTKSNYQWQWTNLTANTLISTIDTLRFQANQTSHIQLILKSGCMTDTLTFKVYVNPPLKGEIRSLNGSLNDTTICFGKSLKLFSTGKGGNGSGYKFNWYLDKILISNLDTLNFKSVDFFPNANATKTLKLVITDNCTSGSDSISKKLNIISGPLSDFIWGNPCNKTKIPFTFTGKPAASPLTTNYSWQFPDGDSSTTQNPFKLLSNVGKNKVTLIVLSSNGCKDYITKEIDIKLESVANFNADDVCEDSAVNFINTTKDGTIFTWYFGDGKTSNIGSPKHKYNIGGVSKTFNVSLLANTTSGCPDTIIKAVTINANPKSDFNFTTSGNQVFFNAIELSASNYSWTFGDGGNTNTSNTKTSYTYSKFPSGKYTACLKVSNIAGCISESCKEITITGASAHLRTKTEFKIYPNPSKGCFSIEIPYSIDLLSIELLDIRGQVVYKLTSDQTIVNLNLNLPSGVYFLRLKDGTSVLNNKIVISH
jgi:hypothetical protein